jgi:hypothetical protein
VSEAEITHGDGEHRAERNTTAARVDCRLASDFEIATPGFNGMIPFFGYS